MNYPKCIILSPTYNDWESVFKLLRVLNDNIKKSKFTFEIIIINDASTKKGQISTSKLKNFKKIRIINLNKNSGSQPAIAVGLNVIKKIKENFNVLVLDSDGEDNPKKINYLLSILEKNREKVIVASRSQRTENFFLKLLNFLRLLFTYLITGKMMNFGNFSCFNSKHLRNLANKPELGLSYSGTLQKYFNIKKIPIKKELRYFGESKVSFGFLISYSLKIISVFKFEVLIYSSLFLFFGYILNLFYGNFYNFSFFLIIYFIFNATIILINYKNTKHIKFLNLVKNISKIK
jgi:hypothetical protein